MVKAIIVINGSGGVGKDTLISYAEEKYRVSNISSITPVKELAKKIGWDGEKDEKGRKFLAELKSALMHYNMAPFIYIKEQTDSFLLDPLSEILFVHIREPKEIERYKEYVESMYGMPVITLLVVAGRVEGKIYGNHADDDVCDYGYDFRYKNDIPEGEEAKEAFLKFLSSVFLEYFDD